MDRRQQQRLTDLEARIRRQERMNRRLAELHGLSLEELEAEESRGVRYGMPSNHAEFSAWCRLNGLEVTE